MGSCETGRQPLLVMNNASDAALATSLALASAALWSKLRKCVMLCVTEQRHVDSARRSPARCTAKQRGELPLNAQRKFLYIYGAGCSTVAPGRHNTGMFANCASTHLVIQFALRNARANCASTHLVIKFALRNSRANNQLNCVAGMYSLEVGRTHHLVPPCSSVLPSVISTSLCIPPSPSALTDISLSLRCPWERREFDFANVP